MQRERKGTERDHQFMLLCDNEVVAGRLVHNLESLGFQHCDHAPLLVIFCTSHGFALRTLLSLDERPPYVIVTTLNLCPEYIEDVWEQAPDVLLAGPHAERELPSALLRVTSGKRYRTGAVPASMLTPTERRVLRLLAFGRSVPEVAQDLAVEQQTVRNTLSSIYQKLGVKSQVQAALYYWDEWKFVKDVSVKKLTIMGGEGVDEATVQVYWCSPYFARYSARI